MMRGHCHIGLVVLFLAASIPPLLRPIPHPAKKGPDRTLARPYSGRGFSFPSVSDAFQSLMLQSRTPGGAAFVEGCSQRNRPVIRMQASTVGAALKSIVAADPRYRWEVRKGVVDLLPAAGVPPLLNIRVREFNSGDSANISSAGTRLFSLPEVKEAAGRLGLSRSGLGSGIYAVGGAQKPVGPLRIDLHDVTVREALDAIVRTNKGGVWIYDEVECGRTHVFQIGFSQ